MEQRSEEWFAARLGKVTGSRVSDIMARTKSGPAASRQNYMAELICQRLTGKMEERFTTAAMQRGVDIEPKARAIYMLETGEIVAETGLVIHRDIPDFGASPDGLVGLDGLIEIKCPNTWTHIETLRSGKPKKEYFIQMQAQMACTSRQWCDFISYDDRLPEDMAYFCKRITRDDDFIAEMLGEVNAFLSELEGTIQELTHGKAA
ncbi:lambda exonuclease family protein [Chromobacterium vaccinii]|uniref:lambda exonuclease family protein n=1 Tax=Chromobacterium vaccinii TaxID=1108595 RepID=UPI003C7634EE